MLTAVVKHSQFCPNGQIWVIWVIWVIFSSYISEHICALCTFSIIIIISLIKIVWRVYAVYGTKLQMHFSCLWKFLVNFTSDFLISLFSSFFKTTYQWPATSLANILFIATNGTASFTFLTYQRFYFLLSQQWYQPLSSVSELERTVHV